MPVMCCAMQPGYHDSDLQIGVHAQLRLVDSSSLLGLPHVSDQIVAYLACLAIASAMAFWPSDVSRSFPENTAPLTPVFFRTF